MTGHRKWSEIKDKFRSSLVRKPPWEDKACYVFNGVFYATDDKDLDRIFDALARAVTPSGGTVASRLATPTEWDEEDE